MKTIFFYSFLLFISLSNLLAKNSYQNAQQLHQKISSDLITLKKQYPGTQTKIYPILDQVSQLYKISRDSIQKKNGYKQKLLTFNTKATKLSEINNTLKKELSNLKKANEKKISEFNEMNKKLKAREAHLLLLTKEKENLNKKINQFEEQQLQQLDSREPQNIENEKNQNLNLNSISEPSSPR